MPSSARFARRLARRYNRTFANGSSGATRRMGAAQGGVDRLSEPRGIVARRSDARPRGSDRLCARGPRRRQGRSEEHTSELQSLMRISYAVFCLKKKNKTHITLVEIIKI